MLNSISRRGFLAGSALVIPAATFSTSASSSEQGTLPQVSVSSDGHFLATATVKDGKHPPYSVALTFCIKSDDCGDKLSAIVFEYDDEDDTYKKSSVKINHGFDADGRRDINATGIKSEGQRYLSDQESALLALAILNNEQTIYFASRDGVYNKNAIEASIADFVDKIISNFKLTGFERPLQRAQTPNPKCAR